MWREETDLPSDNIPRVVKQITWHMKPAWYPGEDIKDAA